MNPNRLTLRHIIIKMEKFRDKENSKAAREKQSHIQGNSYKIVS